MRFFECSCHQQNVGCTFDMSISRSILGRIALSATAASSPQLRPTHGVQARASEVVEAQQSDGAASTKKLWGGRFTGATDPLMEKFNESLPFDKRMWHEDTRVCISSFAAICMHSYINSHMRCLKCP